MRRLRGATDLLVPPTAGGAARAGLSAVRVLILPTVSVDAVGLSDRQEIARFLVGYPRVRRWDADQWAAHLRLIWDENPARTPDSPLGWVIRKDGEIVGFLGSIPRWLWVDGERRTSANATTWYVLPEFGAQALKQLGAFSKAPAEAHFNTTAIERIWRLMEASRFEKFPAVSGGSVLVVDPGPLLTHRLRGPLAHFSPLLRAGGRIARPATRLPLLVSRLRRRATRDFGASTVAIADERFDALWARVRPTTGVTADRSAASLNWYLRANHHAERVLIAATHGARLLGYALFLQQSGPGFARWDCVDLILESASPQIVGPLLEAAWTECRRRDVAMALLPHWTESLGGVYRSLALLPRKLTSEGRYLKLGPGVVGPLLLPSDFYGDYGL